jgi:hypothetical protein
MLKFGGGMLIILLFVYLAALITPKLAKAIDKAFGIKQKEEQPQSPENFKVRDPWMGDLESPKKGDLEQENDLNKKDN